MLSLCFSASCLDLVLPADGGTSSATNQTTGGGTSQGKTDGNADQKPSGNTTVTVRFFKDGEPLGDGQSMRKGNLLSLPTFTLQDNAAYTYSILGWDANGDEQPEVFPYSVTEDTDFELLYTKTEKKYQVDIYDRGECVYSEELSYGADIPYPTIENTITEEEVYFFRGWSYDGVFDGYLYPYVSKSVRIDAVYADGQILKLYYDLYLYSKLKMAGDSLDFGADFKIAPSAGKAIRYYTDDTYTTPFTGSCMPEGNLTLYAREESIDASLPTVHVTSREDLLGVFSQQLINRQTAMEFSLDYTEDDFDSLLPYLKAGSVSYQGYEIETSLLAKILTVDVTYPEVATKTSGAPQYRQIASLNVTPVSNKRSALFDDFAADKRTKEFPVKNSDALYYALEHGYRPVIDADATDIIALYNTMKIFLREAVSDDMTDYQKVRAIYEKLILDTVYDKAVLEMVQAEAKGLTAYRAFSLEGVFLDHLAVCDGISKAFASLCAMEGISCIRVSGKTVEGNGPHAWNKVKLGDNWYVVDATAGGTIVGDTEVLTYSFFLLSDSTYAAHAVEDGTYYADIHATADYPFYDALTVKVNDNTYSLTITSAKDGAALVEAILAAYPLAERSLDLRLDMGLTDTAAAIQAIMNETKVSTSFQYVTSMNSVILIFNS